MASKQAIVLLLLGVIIVISLILSLGGLIPLSYYLYRSVDSTTSDRPSNILLPRHSLALLKTDPANTKAVKVTSNSSNVVSFYTGQCNAITYNQTILKPSYRPLNPIENSRLAFNYNYGDLPLYVAGGTSTLIVNITASNAPTNVTQCPLELFLFDSETSYDRSKRGKENAPITGFVNQSGCIPVGHKDKANTSVIVFSMVQPSSYYLLMIISKRVTINATLSGHVLEYSKDHYKLYKNCSLDSDRNNCSISTNNNECILAQADDYTVINVTAIGKTVLRTHRVGFIVGVAFLSIMALIAFIIVAAIIVKIIQSSSDTERLPLIPHQPENGDNDPQESANSQLRSQWRHQQDGR